MELQYFNVHTPFHVHYVQAGTKMLAAMQVLEKEGPTPIIAILKVLPNGTKVQA